MSEQMPTEWTRVSGDRDLVQRVAALQAANAALEARLAAQEAKMASMLAELTSMRASEATVRAGAEALSADAFKWAVPQRFTEASNCTPPQLAEWLFHVKNYTSHVGMPEDQRVQFAQHFLSGSAFVWWSTARQRRAAWTWESAVEIRKAYERSYYTG